METETIKKSNELIPQKGHPEVGLKVFAILDEILQDRNDKGLTELWNRYYQLRRNRHWKNKRTAKVPLVTANMLAAHHQRTVNTLTDNNPTFDAIIAGESGDHEEKLRTVIRLVDNWWTEQEQQHILEESISDGEMIGGTVEKVSFNVELEFPYGEVETEAVSMFNFGWYPVRAKKIRKCEALLHFEPISIREAIRRWPDFEGQIVADNEYIKSINDQRDEVTGGKDNAQGMITKIANAVKSLVSSRGTTGEESDQTVIVEAWVKDYSKGEGDSNLYPGNIRRIQCGCCGNVVFSDLANPSINPALGDTARDTYLYDKFPFSLTPSVTDPSSMLGMSDFEQLEELNIEVNKTISQMTLVKDKASRLKLINPKDSGVPNEHLTNYPGVINPANAMVANAIRYIDPPKLDPNILKALEIYKDFFYLVAGTFDLESAQTPGRNVIAHKAIAELLENAARMLRGKIRNYSKMIRERGRMYLSHVQNWYTEERWIPFSDETGNKAATKVINTDLLLPIKLTVVSGSTMPRSQIQKREEAINLADKGHLTTEDLLKALDWPDYKEVARRLMAGPMADLFERLLGVGVPKELISYFQEIGAMKDEKEVKRAVEGGDIPPFMALIQALLSGQPEQQPDPAVAAEAELKSAQAQKTMAEVGLIQEQILTERVEQLVRTKGVDFDEEKLKIERAKVVSEMENKDRETSVREKEAKDASARPTKTANKTTQGPYSEKGMKSNNKKWEK